MKIAHVVTYRSKDGAYGGPLRVAEAQAAALTERGHEVCLLAAAPAAEVTTMNGFEIREFVGGKLLPSRGFAFVTSPGLLWQVARRVRDFDVVHVHLSRDLVSLPAALLTLLRSVPFVVQTHGMIDESRRLSARLLDILATRRILRRASVVLTLTKQEQLDISTVAPGARLAFIENGVVPLAELPPLEGRKRVVLFLARLHQRKRPVAFVEMAALMARHDPDVEFIIAGPDEGELDNVRAAVELAGLESRLRVVGPVEPGETDQLMTSASVYVLPAEGEVFPMTILEAFRVGTPVVTTTSLGIADMCRQFGAALVTDGSPPELARAASVALSDPGVARGLAMGGAELVRRSMNATAVGAQLEVHYVQAVNGRSRKGSRARVDR